MSNSQNKQKSSTPGWKRSHAAEYKLRSLDFSQTFLLLQTMQVAIGLFNLPRLVVEHANHSGWIAILLSGVFCQISVVLMLVLLRRFRTMGLYEIMRVVLGRWLGTAFGLLFALYSLAVAADVSRSYVEIVQSWLFPTTSTKMFYVLLLLPAVYCATGGARVLGRFGVITFFATAWMLLLLITPLTRVQTDYYLPIWDTTMPQMAKATWSVFMSSLGFELLLLIYPFIQKKNKTMLAASLAVWQTTLIYLVVVLIAIGFFGEGLIKATLSPTLDMFQIIELPLLQRIEHLGISTWSFLVISTVTGYLWAAGRFVYEISNWKETTCILLIVPVLYFAATWPEDVYALTKISDLLSTIGAVTVFGLPAFLLLVAILRKKRGPEQSQEPAQQEAAS